MKLLITGIHGFVGSNLVKTLKSNNDIYGLDIVAPEKDGVIKTYSWDELDSLEDIDAIIHLAGKAHDTKNQSDADVYFKINTGLTQKIYDWFLKSKAEKLIFFSSVKAAADTVEISPLTENIIPKPIGPYGESKIKAEDYIKGKWDAEGKTTVILRPCMIHGPGNKGNLNLLYGVISKGIPWPLGAFENKRSFTSINNLCFVIDKILSQDIESGIYNMSDDEAMSTNELISAMCHAMGKKCRIWKLPEGLMTGIAKLGTSLHLPLNEERLRKLTESFIVSNEKIKRALGIEKMPVSASDGIEATIRSFSNK